MKNLVIILSYKLRVYFSNKIRVEWRFRELIKSNLRNDRFSFREPLSLCHRKSRWCVSACPDIDDTPENERPSLHRSRRGNNANENKPGAILVSGVSFVRYSCLLNPGYDGI